MISFFFLCACHPDSNRRPLLFIPSLSHHLNTFHHPQLPYLLNNFFDKFSNTTQLLLLLLNHSTNAKTTQLFFSTTCRFLSSHLSTLKDKKQRSLQSLLAQWEAPSVSEILISFRFFCFSFLFFTFGATLTVVVLHCAGWLRFSANSLILVSLVCFYSFFLPLFLSLIWLLAS